MATDTRRNQIAQTMASRLKRNSYTQGGKREYFFGYPTEGKAGYSDCSSAVRKAIERVTGLKIGSNTVAQVNNNAGLQWVEFANGKKYPTVELMPGDLLYFKGTDKSRPYMVGHVEMVDEDTAYLLGHGSGTGPRRTGLRAYCDSRYKSGKGLIGVKRVVLAGEAPEETVSSLGKRLLKLRSPYMRGEDVRELQGLLGELGYDCDGVDGYYGPNTAAAVRAFQHAARIAEDGIYGPDTHKTLMAVLEAGDDEQEEDGEPVEAQIVKATRGDTWIRAQPSMSGAKRAVLYEGESLPYGRDKLGEWYAVEYNGKTCYVHEKYTDALEG